jgi:hypothetical protein
MTCDKSGKVTTRNLEPSKVIRVEHPGYESVALAVSQLPGQQAGSSSIELRLKPKQGMLRVWVSAEGAEDVQAKVTAGTVELRRSSSSKAWEHVGPPGADRTIRVTSAGYKAASVPIPVTADGSADIVVHLVREAPSDIRGAAPPPIPSSAGAERRKGGAFVGLIASSIVAAGGIAVGVAFTVLSNNSADELFTTWKDVTTRGGRGACLNDAFRAECDKLTSTNIDKSIEKNIAIAGFVGGGVALVTGAISLVLYSSKAASPRRDGSASHHNASASCGKNGCEEEPAWKRPAASTEPPRVNLSFGADPHGGSVVLTGTF